MRHGYIVSRIAMALVCTVAAAVPAADATADARPLLEFDGRFDDWPAGQSALADPYFLYFRLSLPTVVGLQAANITTELLIDLDGDQDTGRGVPAQAAGGPRLGVELALRFAPRDGHTGEGLPGGAAATAYARDGSPTSLRHQQLGFAALPTHSSDTFELRLARRVLEQHEAMAHLRGAGRARAVFRRIDADGAVVWQSALMAFDRPTAVDAPLRAGTIPARPGDSVRIMSINVRWGGPLDEPAPLARIVAAVNPDIVLLQEWDTRGRREPDSSLARTAALASWFNTHVPGERPWRARRSQTLGVAIVARAELSPLGPDRVYYKLPGDGDNAGGGQVRYIAARVESPLGPLAVASIHLSCCGAPDSVEDRKRAAQSAAVRAVFQAALADTDAAMAVIGGDFNLVGGVHPQAALAAALDLDGSDLAVAPALAPGDPAATTWRDPRSRFSPSQLDFLLYSDATAELRTAFVADTATLAEAELHRAGLLRDDALFSDHLAVVIDLQSRDQRPAPADSGQSAIP